MAASKTLARHVAAGFDGASPNPTLNFLKNFKKSRDDKGAATAATAATKLVFDTRTLAASATEDLDLAGAFANMTKVHAIYVRAVSANVNAVVVGGAAANAFKGPFADATDKVSVGAGDEFLATSKVGWTVTAATADLLRLGNSGAGSTVTYDIVVIGE